MPGHLHAQVVEAPPHGRRVLRHGLPAHALHGAPGVPTEARRQPVRRASLRLQDPPAGVRATAAGRRQPRSCSSARSACQQVTYVHLIRHSTLSLSL